MEGRKQEAGSRKQGRKKCHSERSEGYSEFIFFVSLRMTNKRKIMKCPKCNIEMEEGLIADRSSNVNAKYTPQWGKKIGGMGFTLSDSHNVSTYRCSKCGYLESYAK